MGFLSVGGEGMDPLHSSLAVGDTPLQCVYVLLRCEAPTILITVLII